MALCRVAFIAIVVITVAQTGKAGKVLLYPYGHCFNSHLLNMEKLGKILLAGGHDVYMLASSKYDEYRLSPRKDSSSKQTLEPDLKLIEFRAPENFKPVCEFDDMDYILHEPLKDRFSYFIKTSAIYCDTLFQDAVVLSRIKAINFDLFITEAIDPCSKIIADYLNVKFIPFFSTGLGYWDGNLRMPSFIPNALAPLTPDMSFMQRVQNFLWKIIQDIMPVAMGFDNAFMEIKAKHNLNISLDFSNTFSRASLKFVNSDFAIDYPAPLDPDTILIGGFFLQTPKQLNLEWETFMQSAGDAGVIIMSFGTVTKRFNKHWTLLFAEAFAKLPQKVIWKYEKDDENRLLLSNYTNIKAVSWMPQTDLLAHPQTRLFITHAGLSSIYEAAYFGVPVVAVPLFGDQFHHAAKLANHVKMGVQLDPYRISTDVFLSAMTQVLHDKTFQENALAVSRRLRKQPMSKADKINFWVNYLLTNEGDLHLKTTADKLTWYQYFCLDVITFLFMVCLSALLVAIFVIYKLCCMIFTQLAQNIKIKSFFKCKVC